MVLNSCERETMNITYIFHSCFLIETAECYCLFDYYRGTLPPLDPQKPLIAFVSHGHADHYNPELYALLFRMGMKKIYAVLSNDIPARRYPRTEAEIIKVYHSREYELPHGMHLKTLLSTDKGVAFLLRCQEGIFFHAGDLNDWCMDSLSEQEKKQMRGSYRAQINTLKGCALDAAFLPLDPRLGDHYADGILYFLKEIDVKKIYPMHFWEQPEIVDRFLTEYPQYKKLF